jgi:hypothetical protein
VQAQIDQTTNLTRARVGSDSPNHRI